MTEQQETFLNWCECQAHRDLEILSDRDGAALSFRRIPNYHILYLLWSGIDGYIKDFKLWQGSLKPEIRYFYSTTSKIFIGVTLNTAIYDPPSKEHVTRKVNTKMSLKTEGMIPDTFFKDLSEDLRNMDSRTLQCLRKLRVKSIQELAQKTRDEILATRGITKKDLDRINNLFENTGIFF